MSIFLFVTVSPGKDSHLAAAVITWKMSTAAIIKQEICTFNTMTLRQHVSVCERSMTLAPHPQTVLLDVLVFLRLDGQILGCLDLYSVELD